MPWSVGIDLVVIATLLYLFYFEAFPSICKIWNIPQNSFKSLRFNKHSNFQTSLHSNRDGTAPVPFKLDWFGGKNCSWISFNNHGACGCFNDKNCGETTVTFIGFHGKVDRANTNISIWTKTSSHDLRLSEWSGTRLAKSRWFCGCHISSTQREMDGILNIFKWPKIGHQLNPGKKTKHNGSWTANFAT